MSTPLPGPPKHRAAPDAVVKVQPGGLTYETRIKWNASILLLQLLLWKIGVWAILVDLLKGIFGQTLGSIIDWLIILLPAVRRRRGAVGEMGQSSSSYSAPAASASPSNDTSTEKAAISQYFDSFVSPQSFDAKRTSLFAIWRNSFST
ncbi:hypothetical protein PIIN_00461 [Serendipita indica DSM 11827]|uniref:Uncharacterized protein n=1 Tax=Serendipita indica (strain DSM 11827) TaxID=1109443 RepID=G4T645_SERID|nr:hypothetical protein PIIN_00461 [Serendipita indica DSM 11827]